jgi:hypothetical protein
VKRFEIANIAKYQNLMAARPKNVEEFKVIKQ